MSATVIAVAAILFGATLVRSFLGFGEALVAVPLLALVLPVSVAAPIAALVSITVATVVVVQDSKHIRWRSASRLVLATLPGIPLGLVLLTRAPEPIVKGVLGGVIIAFSVQALRGAGARHITHDSAVWVFGLVAGILGGAYGMNGPPLAIYGSARGWSPPEFRATLQGYFLPASAAGMVGYWSAGLWTSSVSSYYVISLPLVIAAIVLGRVLNKRASAARFSRAVYVGLLAIGVLLLFEAARPVRALTIL